MENREESIPTTSDLLMEVDKTSSKPSKNENGSLNVNKESDQTLLSNAQTEEADTGSNSNTEMATELIQSTISVDNSETLNIITEKNDSLQTADLRKVNDTSVIDYNLEVLQSEVTGIDTTEQEIDEYTLPIVEDTATVNVKELPIAPSTEDAVTINIKEQVAAIDIEAQPTISRTEDQVSASVSEECGTTSSNEHQVNALNVEKSDISIIEEEPAASTPGKQALVSSNMEQASTLSIQEQVAASDCEEKVPSPSDKEQIPVSSVEEYIIPLGVEKDLTTTLNVEQLSTEVVNVQTNIPDVIQDTSDEPKLDESIDNSDNKISDFDDIANNENHSQDKNINKSTSEDSSNNFETEELSKTINTESGSDKVSPESSTAQDPIASDIIGDLGDTFESVDNQEGADAELCIIPDTEREISQEERDAASSIPPLKDLTEAGTSNQSENSSEQYPFEKVDESDAEIILLLYDKDDLKICDVCKMKKRVNYFLSTNENLTKYVCGGKCLENFKVHHNVRVVSNWSEGGLRVKNFSDGAKDALLSFVRKCATCKKAVSDIENVLNWEIMDFCNEFCLTKYQKEIGSHCANCDEAVQANSLGKYCVRFGNDIRQFCTSLCLEDYKKGLKVCSYCQQDMMSTTQAGFLAPVGDKGQLKDFCSQLCMDKYDIMTNDKPPNVPIGTTCSVCKQQKPIAIEFEHNDVLNYFCQERCLVAFNFVNNISSGKCGMCRRHFLRTTLEKHTMYYDNVQHSFCSNSCENIYIIAHRKIVPCSWCKVKKYNFDMIRRYCKDGAVINMCSVNCLSLYQVSVNAANSKQTTCNICQKFAQPLYHITMSDATIRNFCSYNCVMAFQSQFNKETVTISQLPDMNPVPTGAPKKNKKHPDNVSFTNDGSQMPVITNVQSLATNGTLGPSKIAPPPLSPINTRSTRSKSISSTQVLNSTPQVLNSLIELPAQVQLKQHFIIRPAPVPKQRNVATMCYTHKVNKGITTKPEMVDQEVQTEERKASKILIPIPIPVYVPTPMQMYSAPTPFPIPFPVPIPVPVFIPTTRNSAAGIMKEIKKIQVKIPTDPYEAEILMMAEMVAEEKKEDTTDSESDVDDTGGPEDSYSPEPVDASNAFGDDMLQMALKMATELDEPAVDLEGALTANTITAPQGGEAHGPDENVDDPQPMHHHLIERSQSARRRKRAIKQPRGNTKRKRKMYNNQVDMPMMQHQVQQPPPPPEPVEKPDANMCLKYTFGVNAWKQWVTTKNAELEKSSRRTAIMPKLFKTEILQLTADELNYSLCLFVKEVRKPNGAEYAPDTIYYLCLGIQQYLFENGRIDNIFCDAFYEKFTDCLDEVAKKFSVLYNDSHYIVTRVEEEHLWESKQLGAHSPHVLLSTLMFFNTKHFNLTSVDEHMQLSFSHIMKHWKRNPNQPGSTSKIPGARNVLLRFYPPQSAIQNNARKKKVYEQQENEENPLRCPVKLYEFYLSKCPESVKTRNDVFYLQPERSCVPDSPVWYSTMPLPREALEKMLHRVKMVKEINVALLTS